MFTQSIIIYAYMRLFDNVVLVHAMTGRLHSNWIIMFLLCFAKKHV